MKKISIIIFLVSISFQSCKVHQTYTVNEAFTVELEKEGAGGYQWGYVAIPEVEQIETSKKVIEKEGVFLAGYNKVFSLKGIKPGKYHLEFHFLRSFEKLDTIPEDRIKIIKVKIKK